MPLRGWRFRPRQVAWRPTPAVASSYATITGRTATKAETASGTSITGDLAGIGAQTGDYVVAQFSMSCTVAQFTGPGGSWVQIVAPTVNSTSEIVAAYAMFNPGSAPVGTSSAAAGRQTCLMQAWSGVDPTTPIDVAAILTSGTLPLALTGVTTVTPGALLLSGTCADFSTGTWTYPASMTVVINHTSGTGRGAALAQETIASAGPTGTRTWTATTLQACVGYTIALRPAPAGGATNIAIADAGAGSDDVAVTATVPLTEAGTGADAIAATATVPLADAGSASDAVAVTVPIPLADAGSAADTILVGFGVALTESGAGSDTLAVTAATPLADTGTAVDTLAANAAVPLTQTGSAADAITATATVPLSDSASTSETLAAGVPIAVTETGSAADTLALTITVALADAGSAAESRSVSAAAPLTETGGAAEQLSALVSLALAEAATAVDALSIVRVVDLTDTGAASDTVSVQQQTGSNIALADAATAFDRVCAVLQRPTTGTTARPSTGTTARPGSGTTTRPASGTTTRPYSGITYRG